MDNSPTSLFENYDEDFKQLVGSLKGKLDGEVKELKGEHRKAALKKVENELDEADEIISQMEIEITSMPVSIKQAYAPRVHASKQDLTKLKRSLKDAQRQDQRSDLLGSRSNGNNPGLQDQPYSDGYDQRQRLLNGTDTLTDGSRRLDNAHRIALETEDVGADILRNLRGQRETIEHTRETLTKADSSIDKAAGTLKKMIWRMYQQKLITAGIIGILVLLILIVLYSKFRG